MNKDKEIEELFRSFTPEVSAERIMTGISDKMDVIDTVRLEQDRMSRLHMTVSVCCFIVGLLTGCALMSIVLFHPLAVNDMEDFVLMNRKLPEFTLFYTEHRDMLLILLASFSFILGSLPLMNSNEWSIHC